MKKNQFLFLILIISVSCKQDKPKPVVVKEVTPLIEVKKKVVINDTISKEKKNQTEIEKIDNELSVAFDKLNTNTDSIAKLFTKQLKKALLKEITFNNALTELSKRIKIITSSDNKIMFYSWDDKTGGTWHSINSLAQYKSENGQVHVKQLNSKNEGNTGEFTDCSIYQVNKLSFDGKVFYLTMGWGTHGCGNQHDIVQVFRIVKSKLVKYKSFFPNNKDLAIEYPRQDKLNLKFDSKTNEISYNEFKGKDQLYEPTGKTIILTLINGVFRRK
ncbi:MAG: hypothetical protein WCH34_16695 [Bacteroidota bacterium]